jgi:hypothetical protein
MCLDDPVIWYLMDFGFDTHTPHWHGNNVKKNGVNMASVPIDPGIMDSATMVATVSLFLPVLENWKGVSVVGCRGLS